MRALAQGPSWDMLFPRCLRHQWVFGSQVLACRRAAFRKPGAKMKVAILAGGAGTRLAEETEVRPKPMVEIGGRPILWHIMKHYAHYGHTDFAIALGYKGEYIKRWFADFGALEGSLTVRTRVTGDHQS